MLVFVHKEFSSVILSYDNYRQHFEETSREQEPVVKAVPTVWQRYTTKGHQRRQIRSNM